MTDSSHYHFFLGGHDAEMLEIRKILEARSCPFSDAGLRWDNARLSAYERELASLEPGVTPVCIELVINRPLPAGAVIVDHHGPRAGLDAPTALEQVAGLLGLELSREQVLISANDRGHIRGMIAAGARPEEIERVRSLDRRAQGITEEDEHRAEEAIRNLVEICDGAALVPSSTNRFAAIVDRLWNRYPIIVIESPGEVLVTGPGRLIEEIVRNYEARRQRDPFLRCWYGGALPRQGYFGTTDYDREELFKMIRENAGPFSVHVFLLPFIIKPWPEETRGRDKDPPCPPERDARTRREPGDRGKLDWRAMFDTLKRNGWEWVPYSPFQTEEHYSVYAYFHPYVRKALFPEEEFDEAIKNGEPDFISGLFRRSPCEGTYEIEILVRHDDDPGKDQSFRYILKLKDVSLRVFKTGVAILALELENWDHPGREDVFRINDFGRRVYPQFLTKPPEHNPRVFSAVTVTKNSLLADRIRIRLGDAVFEEPFDEMYYRDPGHRRPYHLHIGRHVTGLFGCLTTRFQIEPIIDDRMYTVCWYSSDNFRLNMIRPRQDGHAFEDSEDWYRFLFIDGLSCCCPDRRMRGEQIRAATYRRWCDWTLYGITRYSLTCLVGSGAPDYLRLHMRRHYRLMAELLLAQRASIVGFFDRVSEISRDIDNLKIADGSTREMADIVDRIRVLHGDFIGFVNGLWFTEVTPQEQGIEMYRMALRNMDLQEQIEELKSEIKELYEYADIQQNAILNRKAYNLSVISAIVIPVALMLAFWGVSKDLIEGIVQPVWWCGVLLVLSTSVGAVIVWFSIYYYLCLRRTAK